MNQRKSKPESPSEIEFGDEILVGFNNDAEATIVGQSAATREEPIVKTQSKPPALERTQATPVAAPRATEAPAAAPRAPQAPATAPRAPQALAAAPRAGQAPTAAPQAGQDEDMDRTMVDRPNPLKEAFDARTLINSAQPKRFNPDETQVPATQLPPAHSPHRSVQVVAESPKPPPASQKRTDTHSKALSEPPRLAHAQEPVNARSSRQAPADEPKGVPLRSEVIEDTLSPSHVAKQQTIAQERSLEVRAPEGKKESRQRSANRPDTDHAAHRTHADAKESDPTENLDDELSALHLQHDRKPSPLASFIGRIRSLSLRKASGSGRSHKSQVEDTGFESSAHTGDETETRPVPGNPRLRNALIAGLVAIVLAFAWMRHAGSAAEPGSEPVVHKDLASQVAGETTANNADSGQGESVAPGAGGKNVRSVIQQFDHSFAKTQDQR